MIKFAAPVYEITSFIANGTEAHFMNNNTYTPQRQARFRRGMLCMYRERFQFCCEQFMRTTDAGDAEYMQETSEEMDSLLRASLVLITEM